MKKFFNIFVEFKSIPLIMIVLGILIHHGVLHEWTTGKGCGEWCIWLGSILYIAIDFVLVDWWYVFKKNDVVYKSLLTLGSAIGNAIVSFGILSFILDQAEIVNFPLIGSIFLWTIGIYISQKFKKQDKGVSRHLEKT